MEQALFRIGGVYRDQAGRTIRLKRIDCPEWTADEAGAEWIEKGWFFGARLLSTGVCPVEDRGEFNLIPGELELRGGQWLPVEEKAEQPRAPYFAEAVEEKPAEEKPAEVEATPAYLIEGYWHRIGQRRAADPNGPMILRDGPAKPAVALPATTVAQEATSHAPLAGLTVLMERDHRLGAQVVHGS